MTANLVYVQESEVLNGVLRYSSLSDLSQSRLVDKFDTLRSIDKLPEFEKFLSDNDLVLEFTDERTRERYQTLSSCAYDPYVVDSPFLKDHSLFPFQHVGLNIVWEQFKLGTPRVLVQWDTGAGKTLLSCLTSQKLFTESKIDKVLVFCKKIKQYDWEQEFKRMTHLDVRKIEDRWSRKQRHDFYLQDTSQVLVLNYEKVRGPSKKKAPAGKRGRVDDYSRTDLAEILEMVKGQRVLVIIDEAQKINTGTSLLGEGFDRLLNQDPGTKCLALTATPYTTSPLNIRNIFTTINPGIPGVSDLTKDNFKREYAKTLDVYHPTPYITELYVKEWDRPKLSLLGKKHENWTHIAMKSDPEIAKQFPENVAKKVVYELSDIDREVYDYAEALAQEKYDPDNPTTAWGYIDTLRMICNTTEGLKNSDSKFAREIADKFGDKLSVANSSKYQLLQSNLETYFESNEKSVLFTFWTNGTLFPYLEQLKKDFSGVPVLPIWGVGMDSSTVTKNIQTFNSTRGPALLITSDVGQEGLNLYAPYLWNIEVPRTYAEYKQRANRINRADSKSKGISHTWVYRPVAVNTIEERVDAKVLRRRAEAEAIRGVVDETIDMEDTVDMTPKSFLFRT
jgi:SNF2 family DNA or RNA helicase